MASSGGLQFQCQECRTPLNITGRLQSESLPPTLAQHHKQSHILGASLLTGSRGDESFVVLDSASGHRRPLGDGSDRVQLKNLDESFVVLPASASASVQRQLPAQQSSSQQGSSPGWSGLIQQLTRAFEIASTETKLDHPLCSKCTARVKEETTKQINEVEADIATYEQALERLQNEAENGPSLQELATAEQELDLPGQQAQLEAAQAELAAAETELAALDKAAEQLAAQESEYWHEFNGFQASLATHVDDKDAMLTKVDRLQAQQARLKRTNVLNEVFHIDCDGVFGTISGFRMGRTSAQPVEWDEINAAWGQAVLLLHTLAQMCQISFQEWQLLPMGSYPRITDSRVPLQLYGPVGPFSTSYNRGMTAFLACMKRFAEVARARDAEAGVSPQFDLPYAVDGDKVGDLSIKSSIGRDSRWTKALKYLLVDLKWCLAWANEHATPLQASSSRR